MGRGATYFFSTFLLLLLTTNRAQAQAPGDQALDTRRQLIEQQQRATVCEVRSKRLEQQIFDLEEQLTATREALARLVAQNAPPAPLATDESLATADSSQSSIEVEELPEPLRPPPAMADSGGTGAAQDGGSAVSAPLAPPSVEALALYDQGYTLFHEQRYADAAAIFQSYAEHHPHTELTDNALFWIGECHYALKDYEAALDAFTTTVARFPEGNKVADALLKAGKSLMALGEQEEAQGTFEEVVNRFPDSPAAATAAELLAH